MVSTKPRHPQRGNLLDLLPCPTKCDKLGTMTICLINAQSVRNKVSSLCDFISDHDFDILTMTETWLRDTPGDSQIIRALAACDIKQLYNVVNALLIKPEHGLSDCGSMDQLANKFSAFFQDKIRMIQENLTLNANPNYVPEDNPDAVDNTLSVLVPATEDEIRGLINKSPSTSSSLDPVPTWLLKEYLTCLLPTITNIVNLSMSTGIVPTARKVRS